MQYGEPTTSSPLASGGAAGLAARKPPSASATSLPSPIRSQTPISQTASTPGSASASHALSGASARVTVRPSSAESCASHGQVKTSSITTSFRRSAVAGGGAAISARLIDGKRRKSLRRDKARLEEKLAR